MAVAGDGCNDDLLVQTGTGKEPIEDVAATEAHPAVTPTTFTFGMQGTATEKRQFVFPLTERGNAQMFVYMFGGLVKYVHEFGQFIVWGSLRWV